VKKDSITLELPDSARNRRSTRWNPWLLLVLGLVWLGQAAFRTDELWMRYTSLVMGIAAVSVAAFSLRHPRQAFIRFDRTGISARPPNGLIAHIPWSEVDYLRFATFTFVVVKKDKRELTVDLGWIAYHAHRTVKPQLMEMAQRHGIEIRTTEWKEPP
jgi:hypothetical protein